MATFPLYILLQYAMQYVSLIATIHRCWNRIHAEQITRGLCADEYPRRRLVNSSLVNKTFMIMSASCGACGKFSNSHEENSLHVFLSFSYPFSCPQNFYFPKFPLSLSLFLASLAFASFLLPFVLVSFAVGIGNEVYLGQICANSILRLRDMKWLSSFCSNRPCNPSTP